MILLSLTQSDLIQIIIGSITAAALIVTGLSYMLSRHSYKKQYEYNRKLKSLEIADNMALLIAGDISKVLSPFNTKEFKAFLDDYFAADAQSLPFDYASLVERCKKAPLYKYGDFDAFHQKYETLIRSYFYQLRINGGEPTEQAAQNANIDFYKFDSLFCLTLNKIEAVAMYFCTEIADEKIAYPSIHQVFLKLIKISSIRISCINKTSLDEYYKNTIQLYRLWNQRQIEYSESSISEKRSKDQAMIKTNKFKR